MKTRPSAHARALGSQIEIDRRAMDAIEASRVHDANWRAAFIVNAKPTMEMTVRPGFDHGAPRITQPRRLKLAQWQLDALASLAIVAGLGGAILACGWAYRLLLWVVK